MMADYINKDDIRKRIEQLNKLIISDNNPLHKCEFYYAITELSKLIN